MRSIVRDDRERKLCGSCRPSTLKELPRKRVCSEIQSEPLPKLCLTVRKLHRITVAIQDCTEWIARVVSSRRLSLAILSFFLLCFLLLQGCAGLAVSESKLMADGRQPAELPMNFRTLGPDRRFSELSSMAVAKQLRARRSGEPPRTSRVS